jgi:hypothetical protein
MKETNDRRININKASNEELLHLFKSEELVWAVKSGRPYNSPEELYRVEGIDEDLFKKIEERIIVEDSSASDFVGVEEVRESEELQEGVIPGFDMGAPEEITGAKDLQLAMGEIRKDESEVAEALKIMEVSPEQESLEESKDSFQEELSNEEVLEENREIIPGYETETRELQYKSGSKLVPEGVKRKTKKETGSRKRVQEKKSDKKSKEQQELVTKTKKRKT